ncbi:hypothetical protein EON82_20765 [bacterium]|nr:MAG: hypothetical protein EON82_20765 [bacterium]
MEGKVLRPKGTATGMKFVLITNDSDLEAEARKGFDPYACETYPEWSAALDACEGADMIFVDLLSTLTEPHKIAGYERFAQAKMTHPVASAVPLVLVAPPDDYELDFMAGWPDFVYGHVRRPVDSKIFRRASTWV